MYFTGAFPLLSRLFPHIPRLGMTAFMYSSYIFIQMLFFIPSPGMNALKAASVETWQIDGNFH